MGKRKIIHIVDPDTRVCAQAARSAFQLGHHAEVYGSLAEFCDRRPPRGIVLVRDGFEEDGFEHVREMLDRCGIWLPIVAIDDEPQIPRVVNAIKGGALDYLALPIWPERLAEMLERTEGEAEAQAMAAKALIEARERIGTLSAREREVLDWLAQGSSNKSIAKELHISPRTVEIHRANMMSKLGASHPAEVVRIRLEAQLDPLTRASPRRDCEKGEPQWNGLDEPRPKRAANPARVSR